MDRNRIIIAVCALVIFIVSIIYSSKKSREHFAEGQTANIDLTALSTPRNALIYFVFRHLIMTYVSNRVFSQNPEIQNSVKQVWSFMPSMLDVICTNVTVQDEEKRDKIEGNCSNLMVSEFAVKDQRIVPKLHQCEDVNFLPKQLSKVEDAAMMVIDEMRYLLSSSCFNIQGAFVEHQPSIKDTDFSDGLKVFFNRSPTWMLLSRPLVVEIPMIGFFMVNYDINEDINIMNSYNSIDYVSKLTADNKAHDSNRCMFLSLLALPSGYEKYNINYSSSKTNLNNALAQSIQNSKLYNNWKLYYTVPYSAHPNVQLEAYRVITVHINKPLPSSGAIINAPKSSSENIQRINVIFQANRKLSISINLTNAPTDRAVVIDTTKINEAILSAERYDLLMTFAINTVTIVAFYQTPDGDQYIQYSRSTVNTQNGPLLSSSFCFNPEKKDKKNSYINLDPEQLSFETPNYAHRAMDLNYTNII